VREIAERVGATPARWPWPGCWRGARWWSPSPGQGPRWYLTENAAAVTVELHAEDLAELDALPAPEGTRY